MASLIPTVHSTQGEGHWHHKKSTSFWRGPLQMCLSVLNSQEKHYPNAIQSSSFCRDGGAYRKLGVMYHINCRQTTFLFPTSGCLLGTFMLLCSFLLVRSTLFIIFFKFHTYLLCLLDSPPPPSGHSYVPLPNAWLFSLIIIVCI